MATITSTGGSVEYVDYKPVSELMEEEGANILLVHLPDFQKEHMKITYVHSTRLIRVAGERLITGNKWSMFNQTFPVPQNCDVQKIQAKIQNGVLTITMPKLTPSIPPNPSSTTTASKEENDKTATQIPQQPKTFADTEKQSAAHIPGATVASTTDGTMKPKDEKSDKVGEEKIKEKKERKEGEVEKSDKVGEEKIKEKKERKEGEDEKSDKVGEEKIKENKERKEGYENTSESKQKETSKEVKESSLADQSEENGKKRKEAKVTRPAEKAKSLKFGGVGDEEKPKEDLLGEKVKNVAFAPKKSVMTLSEERQSLVNIGAAVLVIAALGTYIYYNYGSSGNPTD
ncbi:inactive protein RESTRICTED TEV MOVEMENT 2 [Manihot esculenta]|uniref:SHSP domain-containing protein n=1 Tax=Manihot esculenta TaxID=3983 RepID=A0A2C9VJQ2_MANES|nr:inactive protein RESTRICTED TEV MOVEMENT 2 [Manihot esculenta]OAY45688.1 hypothetical protein MANES_07G083200v8 [Manihot esculenta]